MKAEAISKSRPVQCVQEIFKEALWLPILDKPRLTARELDVLKLLVFGYTAKKIARCLGISSRTVETHVVNLKFKWGCSSKHELLEKVLVQLLVNT